MPRERYLIEGSDDLGDADLLALVLETGCSGRSAQQIAREVLDHCGGIMGVGQEPALALARIKGVGPARAVRLHAALCLGKRSMRGRGDERLVQSADDALSHFRPRLEGLPHEELHGLFLNRRHAVMAYHVLTRGNDAHTIVDPRQVYRTAVMVGAAAVVVAHNHPSGDPSPSVADVEVTQRLSQAGRLLGIDLLDHVIVAGGRSRSLREEGLMGPAAVTSTGSITSDGELKSRRGGRYRAG